MKIITVTYQAVYFQDFEVPDNCNIAEAVQTAWNEMQSIDFQDGGAVWEPAVIELDGEAEVIH